MNLYKVTLRGMTCSLGDGTVHGIIYVVAEDSEQACSAAKADLIKREIGFTPDRVLDNVELLAAERSGRCPCAGIAHLVNIKRGQP